MAHFTDKNKTSKPKANQCRVDALVKSAQYEELATRVGGADGAEYRRMAAHQRAIADALPKFEEPKMTPLAVKALLAKAARQDEMADRITDREISFEYRRLAAATRAFAAEVQDGN